MGPFLRSFPGNEAHKLFSGGPTWGVLGGGQKVYVEKMYVLFPSLNFVHHCESAGITMLTKGFYNYLTLMCGGFVHKERAMVLARNCKKNMEPVTQMELRTCPALVVAVGQRLTCKDPRHDSLNSKTNSFCSSHQTTGVASPTSLVGSIPKLSGHYSREWSECILGVTETTILIRFAFWRGSEGANLGKTVQKCYSSWEIPWQ